MQAESMADVVETKLDTAQVIVPDTFVLPQLPEILTDPEDRAKYLVMHYWDRFDFSNRGLISRPEITEQAFVDYINVLGYVPSENMIESIDYTLRKAATDTIMFRHFSELFEKYLYDPNSPFRNDAFYLAVLENIADSPLLNEVEKSRYGFQLEMEMKNRVGYKANDFSYTIASGSSLRLHDLRSEFTLLMFTDPGCVTCAEVTRQLNRSSVLNRVLEMNTPTRAVFTVLAVAPDSGIEEWSEHIPEIPARWIYAYDKAGEITRGRLYDIKAFPTIYLLDKDKNVILKDVSVETVESFLSDSFLK